MNAAKYAEKVYQFFSTVPGNQHIASQFALERLLQIVDEENPKSILEVGLGIGSISYAIVQFLKDQGKTVEYVGTELNGFCLEQLPLNLKDDYAKIKVVPDVDAVDKNSRFDMVIIDGSDAALSLVKNLVAPHAVLFVEGDRASQANLLRESFPKHKFVISISDYKNSKDGPFDPSHWSSGGKTIYVNPTFAQSIRCFSQKIRTAWIFRFSRK